MEIVLKAGFEPVRGWESLYVHRQKKLFLNIYVDDFHCAGSAEEVEKIWSQLEAAGMKLEDPVPFSGNTYLGCTQRDVPNDWKIIEEKQALYQDIMNRQPKEGEVDALISEAGTNAMLQQTGRTSTKKKPKPKPKKTAKKKEKKAVAKGSRSMFTFNNGPSKKQKELEKRVADLVKQNKELKKDVNTKKNVNTAKARKKKRK